MKYTRIKKVKQYGAGGYTGAIAGAVDLGANIGASELEKRSMNSDGLYNENKYGASQALKYSAQGATLGTQFGGPVGTIIGAGAGAVYGFISGSNNAANMNTQIKEQRFADYKTKSQQDLEDEKFKAMQQNSYNMAYNNINNPNGNVNSTLYATGGKLPKYPDGGKTKIDRNNYQSQLNNPNFDMTGDASRSADFMANAKNLGFNYHSGGLGSKDIAFKKGTDTYIYKELNGQKGLVNVGNTDIPIPTKQDQIDSIAPIIRDNTPNPMDQSGRSAINFDTNMSTYKYDDGTIKYYDNNGKEIIPLKAMGGKLKYCAKGGDIKAPGGKLVNLASDTVKAEGNTHAEGGIKLKDNNGKPYAEVEDDEVIKGNLVYSDRIKLPNGETVANEAEKYAKLKGKNEDKLLSSNYREKNSANRNTEFADRKLGELYEYQESTKNPVNNGEVKFANGGDLVNGVAAVVPYLDNIYNTQLINQTPDIPLPTQKQTYYAKAMPMKTNYDVSANLNDVNSAYGAYAKNIDDNTSSSNVARGNKLAAFADVLKSKNQIYQNKENIETQLNNTNNKNIQDVNNFNAQNAQDINNLNLSQKDQYNYAIANRSQNILNAKSANVADVVNNGITQIQDYNMSKLDNEKIMVDALKYNDGAGFARLVGTSQMDNLVKDQTNYKQIEKALINSKQDKALGEFYKKYGKQN